MIPAIRLTWKTWKLETERRRVCLIRQQIFPCVEDSLDQRPSAQDGFFVVGARHGLHVLPELDDELDPLPGQSLDQSFTKMAFVGEYLVEDSFA